MKHASFFSGVGGLDLGFERAGIQTVSLSEIDPYANAVLAERFPDAPNLGSITEVDANDIPEADIWSGGFPCQDLSVAGKRAGFAGKRSSLAFTFLDLVEQRRPRWLVLENVPGLFSSNKGADFGRLLYEMEQLGYGVSWRTLDARYFGVAQRRRRVFLVASLESDRASEVLLECNGCERHPSPRTKEGQGVASLARGRARGNRHGRATEKAGATDDAHGVRTTNGLARRLDDQPIVEGVLSFPSRFGSNANVTEGQAQSVAHSAGAPAVMCFPRSLSNQATRFDDHADPLTVNAGGGVNSPAVMRDGVGGTAEEDDLLPVGLDSHRYRCCGNGVVAPVAEWIGRRIVEVNRQWREEGK